MLAMNDDQDRINELQKRFDLLYNKQKDFIQELKAIKLELGQLKGVETQSLNETVTATSTKPLLDDTKNQDIDRLESSSPKKLKRDLNNKLIGGVCAGIAEYLNIDRIVVRIIWVILTLVTILQFGIGIILYLALWIFVGKSADVKRSRLEKDIQLENISQSSSAEPIPTIEINDEQKFHSLEETSSTTSKQKIRPSKVGHNLEKFVGENLISIAGVIITILGVAVGVKYSIENELISPVTRIVLGYLSGIALLGFGIKLKSKYNNYSAVLVSGAIAILYFITYSAYAFYDLIPQFLAFVLMVVFTTFTVIAAINYNRQVIAHIGLVGAYGVPFLLSEGSNEVGILFSYMSIINIGILVISFWRYWKPLLYSAFGMTWFIYLLWYVGDSTAADQTTTGFTFLAIFFAIFYVTFLAYKLHKKERFAPQDILLVLANSAIFYGIGYHILDGQTSGKELLGLFTLGNALIHFIVSIIIYKQKLADKQLFYLVSGLVLIFITLAVPVQLDGNWVTLLWVAQAALLFWIGRTKQVPFYETLSYPLMILACISVSHDWTMMYDHYVPEYPETRTTPLLNINFLSTLLFIAAFVFIHLVNRKESINTRFITGERLKTIISYGSAAVILYSIFSTFQLEISNYYDQLYKDSFLSLNVEGEEYTNDIRNHDLIRLKTIWIINFTMLFISILCLVNFKKIKNQTLGLLSIGLMCLTALMFLSGGLYELGQLRESYIEQTLAEYYNIGVSNIYIRYISILLFTIMIGIGYRYVHQESMIKGIKKAFDIFLHVSIIWILSSELIHWMNLVGSGDSDKLGLSILWGLYSLLLIVLGIFKRKKHLRIAAIVLFGVTLAKLFFYDIAHLETIAKTIVLVSLGVLLLLISFLYNKFKPSISNESEY